MTDRLIIHWCTQEMIEGPPPEPEPEVAIELEPGHCPVHDRVCEYGCEMECFLADLTEEELAMSEVNHPEVRA